MTTPGRVLAGLTFLAVALALTAPPLTARAAPRSHAEPYPVDSLERDNFGETAELMFEEKILVPGAPWLRLHFSAYDLGERSFLRIASLDEENVQILDGGSLPRWGGSSAYFNGDGLEVELWVASGEEGIHFAIEQITVGDWPESEDKGEDQGIAAICGGSDDRSPASLPRMARFTFVDASNDIEGNCTAYMAVNGAFVSAGHCVDRDYDGTMDASARDLLEFDVPDSSPGGVLAFADAENQYPIDLSSMQFHCTGSTVYGDDWAVFGVFANSTTGLLPQHAMDYYARVTREIPPNLSVIRVTGYGRDDQGERSGTEQFHESFFYGEVQEGDRSYLKHVVDTDWGSSGSPIQHRWGSYRHSIGVHTKGGCDIPEPPYSNRNKGTSFNHVPFAEALDGFLGPDTVYVDPISAAAKPDGSIFAPCPNVNLAASWVPEGGIISILRGYYDETPVFDTACTIVAPLGPVVIGEPAP
jgi:hypothetical protein